MNMLSGPRMFEVLLDSPAKLALLIGLLAVANYVVGRWALAEQTRQNFVESDHRGTGGPAGRAVSDRARLAKPFIMTAVIIMLTLIADQFTRELMGGGWLVMQIASLGLSTADLLAGKSLQKPDAAEGHIRYSVAHLYRVTGARSVGMAIVAGTVGLLFGSWAFLMGSLLMLATAIGWYRRGGQTSRMKPSV